MGEKNQRSMGSPNEGPNKAAYGKSTPATATNAGGSPRGLESKETAPSGSWIPGASRSPRTAEKCVASDEGIKAFQSHRPASHVDQGGREEDKDKSSENVKKCGKQREEVKLAGKTVRKSQTRRRLDVGSVHSIVARQLPSQAFLFMCTGRESTVGAVKMRALRLELDAQLWHLVTFMDMTSQTKKRGCNCLLPSGILDPSQS